MIDFKPRAESGLTVVDTIENRLYSLDTSTRVAPKSADENRFYFPIDRAIQISTSELTLDNRVDVFIRDTSGNTLLEVGPSVDEEFGPGTYSIELNAPIKIYLQIDGPLSITADINEVAFGFNSPTVYVGARSYHRHPSTAVTTTKDPEDMMAALSALSSALKTTTCERSYPTLRGHPPTIECGDKLHIPDGLSRPETGIKLEVPPSLESVFVAAPLAYYLGAKMVPGDEPRLVTERFEHFLTDLPLEREIERLLKQIFFLDCLTRTQGYYQIDLYEREQVDLELDFGELYDKSIAEQLPAYLSIPFETVEPFLPRWPLTAHISPTAHRASAIPFVLHDLGLIRIARGSPVSDDCIPSFLLESFFETRGESSQNRSFVRLEPSDSLEQAWFADGIPINATKAIPKAFENKLEQEPMTDAIEIAVVCNDLEMGANESVEEVYRSRDGLDLNATTYKDLSMSDLRLVLESDVDFLHYIGHIDDDGFRCRDGWLDTKTLSEVSIPIFLLNACRSYDQGAALIEAGAVGGIVTFSEVVNDGAAHIGYTVARLLDLGFPLRAALAIAQGESIVGGHYLVIGDGSADVVQVEQGVPMLCEIETADEPIDVLLRSYPSREGKIGTMVYPYVEPNDQYFLTPGPLRTFRLTTEMMQQYLVWHRVPVRKDDNLVWDDPF